MTKPTNSALLEDFFEFAPCGFATIDAGGLVHRVNHTLLGWLNQSREQVEGKQNFRNWFEVGNRIFLDTHFFPLLKMQGELKEVSLALKTIDGRKIPVLVGANKLNHPQKPLGEYRVTLLDISQRKSFEQELIKYRKSLEQNNQKLKQINEGLEAFTRAASHDLNAPLNTIAGLVGLLGQNIPTGSKHSYFLELIHRNIHRMKITLKDLLDYAKQDGYSSTLENIPLQEVAREAMELIREEIERSKASINIAELPMARGNRIQLTRVFQNLFSNAIKYRSEDSPVIHVYGESSDNTHTIHVRDNGIGFDMSYADKIFGFLERLHSHDDIEGTGIGLALCKKIVEQHGGKIYAYSQVGKGSTFTFQLPNISRGHKLDNN
ncbi:sensor histidine kinase [Pleomorphovibrio marinus]|uniref:sensor histidine kinase n=1 Tax=Pleomorphovibrio marinus TaxID=2164132 RepID=UPI000E0B1757|nr:ATP-binding protein [Pleomorphovibrio marinus]